MSKFLPLLLALLVLSSCVHQGDEISDGVTVYYPAAEQTGSQDTLLPVVCDVPEGFSSLEYALQMLFTPPRSDRMRLPYPDGVSVRGWTLAGDVLTVDLSREYLLMHDISLTIADACLVKTLAQFSEIASVSVTAEGAAHPSRESSFYDIDGFITAPLRSEPYDVELGVYFAMVEQNFVQREVQSITVRDKNLAPYVIEMLIGGPKSAGLLPVMPEGTRLIALTIEDGVCFVSFSGEFITRANGDTLSARMTLVALANSLTELDGISRVRLLVDGAPLQQYFMYDISDGLEWEGMAVPTGRGVNFTFRYLDISNAVVPVTVHIELPEVGDRRIELLTEYIAKSAPNGLHKPIDDDTGILSFDVDGRILHLNLTKPPADESAFAILFSIAKDTGGVDGMILYSNGERINEEPYTGG